MAPKNASCTSETSSASSCSDSDVNPTRSAKTTVMIRHSIAARSTRASVRGGFLSAGGASSVRPRREPRSEEHTSELQSLTKLVCRLLLEKKKKKISTLTTQNKKNTTKNHT